MHILTIRIFFSSENEKYFYDPLKKIPYSDDQKHYDQKFSISGQKSEFACTLVYSVLQKII